jgi:hypothetical protein
VIPDPRRAPIPAEEWAHQQQLLAKIWREVNDVHQSANKTRSIIAQTEQRIEATEDNPKSSKIREQGEKLIGVLKAWEIHEPQAELPGGVQDYVSVPNRLLSTQYLYLKSAIDQDPPVTEGAEKRAAELSSQWAGLKADMNRILDEDLAAYNTLLSDSGVEQIETP